MNNTAIKLERGRQLFVDDHLIEATDLRREFHRPKLHPANPILKPESEIELNGGICPVACPFQDGAFYDPIARQFRLYYQAGWFEGTALATSVDGIRWERPDLGVVPGTNLVLPDQSPLMRDGAGVWLDHEAADPAERYKMYVFFRDMPRRALAYDSARLPPGIPQFGRVYTSPDGVRWRDRGDTGPGGDNTNFFYNPFRRSWFYSVRTFADGARARSYRETADFVAGRMWDRGDLVPFAQADALDLPAPSVGDAPQIYNVDAVAYESLMLGVFGVHRGPSNELCFERGTPKITDLELAFSRDGGRNWSRPARNGFLECSREPGTWNYGYLHAAGGVCLVVGDLLYFYIGAFSGISPKLGNHLYAGGSTGLATLRRDGFASMGTPTAGRLLSRLFTADAGHLFVNADAARGRIGVAVLDEHGAEIPGYEAAACVALQGDSTRAPIVWRNKATLDELRGRPIRLRFDANVARLYSFWLAGDTRGASGGYVAAGGPGFAGAIDA